jgi:peptidoglycan/xylan/chitin deacetylase (PgdA/CDA1 family)
MKRLKFLLAALIATVAVSLPVYLASADPTNLIANASVETATGTNPANWTANKWGTNTTALTYENTGRTGSKSVKVNMTARTSGDAKWMHDAVNVASNKTYAYSGYYKSNVNTKIVLQYTTTTGTFTYADLVTVNPSATDWAQVSAEFTTPANVTRVTVMHIVESVGWVQADDFSLVETTPTPPTTPPTTGNLVLNPSAETANGTLPASWTNNKWGTNTTSFTYATNGHTGGRSLLVSTTARTSGDAKWTHAPVTVTGNKAYTFSDWYKASRQTSLVLQYTDAAGAVTYVTGKTLAASATNWTEAKLDFTTPANATKVVVLHLLAGVGTLQTDDYSVTAVAPVPDPDPTPDPDPDPTPDPTPGDDENLFANGSLETANGTVPASWTNNKWGTNTASFTYENTGRTGTKSVKTTMTAFTDGDAKWYAEPVNVVAGKTYIYRDYYKSNVVTPVVVAFIDAAGNWTFLEKPNAPASTDWKQYETSFTVPAGATKATVLHVLNSVGNLTLDDVLLQVAAPSTPETVPNNSLELGAPTPTGWSSSKWGNNTATHEHVNEGHTGTKSVKVTMSNYVDGDAKWFFDPINTLTPGKQYRFTAWYKGTALPHAVALYIDETGKEQYVGLPSPQTVSATTWTKYTDTLTVPANAKWVSVFFFVNQNGWLQTDDYSIADYHPNGFNNALLTLTFDDGHEENATTALPILNQHGLKSTQCYATSFLEGQSQQIIDGALAFHNSGHEICSHTVTHPFLTQQNDTQLNHELQHSQDYLESLIGGPVRNFASPYGDYNAHVNDVIDGIYRSHRTVDEGFNSKDNFNIYRLRVQNILDTTTAAQVQQWIEQAKADKTWLILVYHRVANNPGPYDSFISDFTAQMQVVKDSGITVKTMNAALDEVTAQL